MTINATMIESLERSLIELDNKVKIVEGKIAKLLIAKGFRDREELSAFYIKDKAKIAELMRIKESIEDEGLRLDTLFKAKNESLENALKKDTLIDKSLEELGVYEKELSDKRDAIIQDFTRLEQELKQDAMMKKEQAIIIKEIELQKNVLLPWETLNKLIGSAKGDKYQKFVQNLTLGHLLNLANRHLSYLSDRYKLIRTNSNKLDISIVDGYNMDKERVIKTLSGGEKFLVSLALALGLSDLVNDKIKVDSLFLDEGFGSLDENSLNMAISALENLHAKGKLIGVISHVTLLKDRISAQILLTKKRDSSVITINT